MFDIKSLLNFIKNEMTLEEALIIGLSDRTYYRLKKDPSYISRTKSETLIKILSLQAMSGSNESTITPAQNIIPNEDKSKQNYNNLVKNNDYNTIKPENIIGIDINATNVIVASSADFSVVFNSNQSINECIQQNMTYKSFKIKCQSKLTSIIDRLLNLSKMNNEPTTFVMGKYNSNNLTDINMVFHYVYQSIENRLGEEDQIIKVAETATSITCPICNNINRRNRTNTNRFLCKKCGYEHDVDDLVAARNIANIYYKQIAKPTAYVNGDSVPI